MKLSLLIEPIDRAVDGMVEVLGVGKGAVGEVVPLEVAPAALDGVQLRDILGQPFEREPRPFGERLGGELAGVDRLTGFAAQCP
jgi:hypothetical protein